MTAHTPGPWEISKRSHHYSSNEIRPVKPWPGVIPLAWVAKLDDGEANARLIAAAPEMLDALLVARDQIREFLPTALGEALTTIEAAIAKARGSK